MYDKKFNTVKGEARRLLSALHRLPSDTDHSNLVRLYNEAISLSNPPHYHPQLETLIGQLIWRKAISSIGAGAIDYIKPHYKPDVVNRVLKAAEEGKFNHTLWLAIPPSERTASIVAACTAYMVMYKYLLRCFSRVTYPHPNSLNAKKRLKSFE